MKCRTIQESWLLAATGELPLNRTVEVMRHTAECPECRAFTESYRQLHAQLNVAPAVASLRPDTRARILNAARRQSAPAGRVLWRRASPAAWSWAAAAALLVLGIGIGWWRMWPSTAPDSEATLSRMDRIAEVRVLLAVTLGDEPETSTLNSGETPADELNRLASELLDLGNGEDEGERLLTEPAGIQPTSLRWRSIREVPSGRYG